VLVGLAARVVVAVVLALVVGHFVRPDRLTTPSISYRVREGAEALAEATERAGSSEPVGGADLPAPRDGDHADGTTTPRRRRGCR
jgi:hypothetical protein